MCRFTVRDLLWLILTVAMGLGWWVRESDLRAQLESASREWRQTAEGLQRVLELDGWAVQRRGGTLYVNDLKGPRIPREFECQFSLE